ncbi:hypothetical protein [Paenibacillus cymbidii]|uniref:hypothetical protein n=1 Tax=Paenibacillus cymbidii TaxID=1639034 RepID=UPI0010817040|nr:hypothetical protein [Paenibacillus cymbidii]
MSDRDETRDEQGLPCDSCDEGRDSHFMDIDRMINEGLGGGNVTLHNGLIEETTTDTMKQEDSYREDE